MFLGVDCGTQGTKAILMDEAGVIHGNGHAPHRLIEKPNGAREQEPSWWVEAMVLSVRAAFAQANVDAGAVKSIGISGQQHGLVVLDSEMRSIRAAKLWNDTETSAQNAEVVERLGGPFACFDEFGIVPLTGYTISKLLWLRQKEPENFARVRHVLLPHEYLNYWLTGSLAAEFGDASGTGYFDVRRRMWAEQPLAAIDGGTGFLRKALPSLIAADDIVGTLRPEAAAALGLSRECLVSAGGGDNMMGAIGTGNVREGVVTISLGTSSTVYAYSEKPVGDRLGRIAPFCSSSGGWLPLVCTMNSTNVTACMLNVVGRDVSYISEALAATRPGADGITFLPFLNGERTPDLPNAQGSIFGLTANNLTSANMMRATIEGVTYGVLAGLNLILQHRKAEHILLIGGGARSQGWRQLIADATGSLIQVPTAAESGCVGAAMQAMWTWKKHRGDPELLVEIAKRCSAVDPTRTEIPNPANRPFYEQAISVYAERLKQQYGVSSDAVQL